MPNTKQGLEGGGGGLGPDPAFPLLFYDNSASRHCYIVFEKPVLFFQRKKKVSAKTNYKFNGAENKSRFAHILGILSC